DTKTPGGEDPKSARGRPWTVKFLAPSWLGLILGALSIQKDQILRRPECSVVGNLLPMKVHRVRRIAMAKVVVHDLPVIPLFQRPPPVDQALFDLHPDPVPHRLRVDIGGLPPPRLAQLLAAERNDFHPVPLWSPAKELNPTGVLGRI